MKQYQSDKLNNIEFKKYEKICKELEEATHKPDLRKTIEYNNKIYENLDFIRRNNIIYEKQKNNFNVIKNEVENKNRLKTPKINERSREINKQKNKNKDNENNKNTNSLL